MSRRHHSTLVTLTTLVALLAALLAPPLAADARPAARAAAAATVPTGGQMPATLTPLQSGTDEGISTTSVTLPTGQRVDVTRAAPSRTAATVRSTSSDGLNGLSYNLSVGGQLYVVPATATAELGANWTVDDFNVTRLAGEQTSTPALAPDGGQSQSPAYQLRTLTIQATDITGAPANNVPFVVLNVDDMSRYVYFGSLSSGLQKLSVPQGRYSVIGFFTDYDRQTGHYAERIVTVPQITVSQDTNHPVELDERQATSRLSVNTPRPATLQTFTASVFRSDDSGLGAEFGFTMTGDQDIYVLPTSTQVSHGDLEFTDYFRLAAPDDSYTYDVEFPASGKVPADTHYSVSDDQLATVKTTYQADVAGRTEGEQRMSWLPWQVADVQAADPPLTTPATRTEYITGNPSIDWQQTLTLLYSPFVTAGQSVDSFRSYSPGEQLSTVWRGGPTHPGVQYDFGANPGHYLACSACREGNVMHLALYPFGDNTQGHVTLRDIVPPFGGGGVHESTIFKMYKDGLLYAEAPQALGDLQVPAESANYQFVYDNTRTAPWWTLSTSQQTTWSFRSSSADGTGTLPHDWFCDANLGKNCGIIPLLLPYIQLPTNTLGSLDPGTFTVPFTVTHIQNSSAAPVTASLQVSFDGGGSWKDLPVTGDGNGKFSAQLSVPAATQTDGYGALRITASDNAGSQLSQTVIRAFAVSGGSGSAADPGDGSPPPPVSEKPDLRPACSQPASSEQARCFAMVNNAAGARNIAPDTLPAGYGPADLQAAYGLTATASTRGADQTIALVDAYNNPNVVGDLATYRATFGLPPCPVTNGCLRVVNQRGDAGPLPRNDSSWGLEIALDLDMVSAVCPNCHILLVEADSNNIPDLAAAVTTAGRLGANAISNSYGAPEFTGLEQVAPAYSQPGRFITASSGDEGFGIANFPAVLTTVTAVGGTTLHPADNARGWAETAWGHDVNSSLAGGAGSGCSAYVEKPNWQHDGLCHMRMVSDVSMVADPDSGMAVYDSYVYSGWRVVGGTSASAPMIAAIAGLAGNTDTINNAAIYAAARSLHDVVGGSNGSCGGDYPCTGVKKYDGPTGLGSPDGTAAF